MLVAGADGGDHVLAAAGDDDAERRLAVVGAVVRVDRPGAGVEADLALRPRPPGLARAPRRSISLGALGRERAVARRVAGQLMPRTSPPRRASARAPGPAASGRARAAPRPARAVPSKSIRSIRTWSWKYSRCSKVSIAQQTWAETAGAQWAEKRRCAALQMPSARSMFGDAADPGDVGLDDVDAGGEIRKLRQVPLVLAGGDLHPGRAVLARRRRRAGAVLGADRLLEVGDAEPA